MHLPLRALPLLPGEPALLGQTGPKDTTTRYLVQVQESVFPQDQSGNRDNTLTPLTPYQDCIGLCIPLTWTILNLGKAQDIYSHTEVPLSIKWA